MSFCSRASVASHEAMAGTGVRAEAYLFLPVPKRLWRASEFNEGWATPGELAAIRTARTAGVVTRLYNPSGDDDAMLAHTAGPRPDALAALLDALGGRWPEEATPSPLLVVCTQGTRDRCCAKWGFAVHRRALGLFEAGASPFRPLESSHLGGDRFAATGVVFPSGSMYGHLDETDLAALLAAEASGRIVARHYRGRVFDPPTVQVVRAGLARDGLLDAAAAPLEIARGEDGRLLVDCGAGRFEVELATTEVTFFPNCHRMAEGRLNRGRRLVYVGAKPID